MNITIVGLGLIGGSIGIDLRSQMNVTVCGIDQSENHTEAALRLGIIHHTGTLENDLKKADIVVLSTPVDQIEQLLPYILEHIADDTTVIDVGSTKEHICKRISDHRRRHRFVAAHPLAGTEFSGPEAAVKGLFNGCKNIICEREKSAPDAINLALKLFGSLGMNTIYMKPDEHDRHLAYVSHLSHVSSFMLGLTVLDMEKDEKRIFDLAGTGFASTVRLAKSNPKTWSAIFGKNKNFLLEALDRYISHLQNFRNLVANGDVFATESLMTASNEIRRILK